MQKSRSYVQKLLRLHVLGDDQTFNLYYNFISAKWCHFTFTSVKLENFSHLLKKIGSAKLNAVKECRLLKPPLWKEKALRMSFKTYSMGDLQRALSEQESVDLHMSKTFSGSKEIAGDAPQLSGRAALEAAKRKRVHQQASLMSQINCGEGEGRATRECELIWRPIFDSSDNGMLTLRVYVGKVHL